MNPHHTRSDTVTSVRSSGVARLFASLGGGSGVGSEGGVGKGTASTRSRGAVTRQGAALAASPQGLTATAAHNCHSSAGVGAAIPADLPAAVAVTAPRSASVAGTAARGGRGRGSTASLRLIGLTVLVVTAFLALTASSALAARGHEYLGEKIGTPCTTVTCAPGELKEPSAVAVNETTGDIYVLDQGNSRVQRFSSTGAFLGGFDGGPTYEKEPGVTEPTTEAGHGGNPWEIETGAFLFAEGPQASALAVDNYCALHELAEPKCKEEDPSAGTVYVDDNGLEPEKHRVVDRFSPTGEYLGQITKAGTREFNLAAVTGVAVDREGTLWVYREELRVADGFAFGLQSGFAPPEVSLAQPFSTGSFAGPNGFAVGPSGDFYGGLRHAGETPVSRWDSEGDVKTAGCAPGDSRGLAVDQAAGTVFTDDGTVFTVRNAACEALETIGFGGDLAQGAGIGVDAASGFAYIADSAGGDLLALAPTLPGPPQVEAANQFVSGVTSTEAELHSVLSPQSEAGEEPTTYRFQYGPCASLAACTAAPFPLETPVGSLPPDFAAHPVAAFLTGLQPGTIYHFRLVAENEHEGTIFTTEGPEATFSTQPLGALVLPDSRQWEMVSPPDKLGAQIEPIKESGIVQAAADGAAITYIASTPATAEPEGFANQAQILSRRSPSGWSTRDIDIPHAQVTGSPVGQGPEYKSFSPDLAGAAVQPFGPFNPALSPEASEQTPYLHDLSGSCGSHCYRPLVSGKAGFENVPPGTEFGEAARCEPSGEGESASARCGPEFRGATANLGHVVLSSTVPLAAGMPVGALYEWSAGSLTPLSLLPDGEAVVGNLGLGNQAARGAISADGSRVAWEETNKALYLRLDATEAPSASGACDEAGRACTIQLDALTTGPGTSGGGQFQFMSADGSRVFFTDTHRLTADSGLTGADLYECRVVEPGPGHHACDLTDLTPKTETPGEEPAAVQGSILGASVDGSHLYLVADGVLAANTVENGAGPESAQSGQPNLYLLQDGATTFIAGLSTGDEHDWVPLLEEQPTRVSPDGNWLELMSQARPTGYDNRDRASGAPVAEVYLYDAAAGKLRCASCDPTGARPIGFDYQQLEPGSEGLVGGGRETWLLHGLVAGIVPGWTQIRPVGPVGSRYQPRYLDNSGRLFFNAGDGLVPQDSNGTFDVYQYEPPQGAGQPASNNCTTASATYSARSGGCVSLISSGTSKQESAFLDASESGDDVFFLTYSRLRPQDTDTSLDVYDAHVCSAGSPCLPEPPAPPPACQGDACQQPAVPPVDSTPGSLTFNGAGNVFECPKGKVRKNGKCVAKHKAKKHHKKSKHHHKRSKQRHAKVNRRTGK